MARRFVIFLLVLIAAAAGGMALIYSRTPSNDRDWAEPFTRLARFTPQADGTLHLANLRDWTFDESGPINRTWRDARFDSDQAAGLWFFMNIFPGSDRLAHTMLSFRFDTASGPRHVVLSVEVRKRKGQTYSALRGLFRTYEMMYVWSTERDALTDRALLRQEVLYGYRLNLTPQQVTEIFNAVVADTNALAATPRFYNTLTTNCTSALAAIVNKIRPGALPWHWSFILTGYADRYLHRLGYIGKPGADIADLRSAARLNDPVAKAAAAEAAAFSRLLRQSMGQAME